MIEKNKLVNIYKDHFIKDLIDDLLYKDFKIFLELYFETAPKNVNSITSLIHYLERGLC